MLRNSLITALFVLSSAACASPGAAAQSLQPGYVDPAPVLEAATRAIGADRIKCVTVKGNGIGGRVGQERYVRPEGDWPRDRLENFVRTIDWREGAMSDEFDRTPGMTPASYKYGMGWLGGTPTQKNLRQFFAVSQGQAWHRDGPTGIPEPVSPEIAEFWELDVWLNPVGFLKAAALPGANPIAAWRWELGESGRDGPTTSPERVSVVSIEVMGRYRVNATINERNLIQRIHTRFPHPVLGDLNIEHEFSDDAYADLGNGMRFPTHWHHHQGYDDNFNVQTIASGHNAFDAYLDNITVNQCGDKIVAPLGLKSQQDPARIVTQQLATGVFLIGGSTHNSVAIELKDHVVIVEAPLNEARSLAVINETMRLFPGKQIRFLINTHQHFDHIGGLRTYAHIGATIITHARNFAFYNRDVVNYIPRMTEPDLVSIMPPTELTEGYSYELVRENYVLTDGERIIRINYVQPLELVEGMLMVYLPNEKLLIQADLVNTHEPLVPGPSNGESVLFNMVRTLNYQVDQIVPIHGMPIAWSTFLADTGLENTSAGGR